MRIIEGRLHDVLKSIIMRNSPNEAVGLILPDDRVVELPNYAKSPTDQFEIHKNDILEALKGLYDIESLTLWHSHPSGGVGPSRTDLQNKVEVFDHLVLSIVDGEIVPTWY